MNIAIDIDNNIYWTENGKIRKKDKETYIITDIFVFPKNAYSDFVLDSSSQNMYFYNLGKLHKLDLSSTALTVFPLTSIHGGNVYGMVLDNDTGDIYFTSESMSSIYKTNISGKFLTKLAGNGFPSGDFNKPWGIAHDKSLNCLYIADKGNNCISKIDLETNTVSKYAGGSYQRNIYKVIKEDACFNEPTDVDLDGFGNMFICDYTNNQIKRIDSSGMVTLFAGSGAYGKSNGLTLQESTFCNPVSILIKGRTMYIADEGNKSVRMITGSYRQ
jgi:DNA-binding beta-propeller fold protein YncE